MTDEQKANLQVVWEQLNGAVYDLERYEVLDGVNTIEDCIARLEAMGIGVGVPDADDTYDEYGVNTKNSFNTPPKGEQA